jgi:ring-1,2-phenylacetyl-CoA epoxidase subunit PaaE
MSVAPRFHELTVTHIQAEAAGAVAIRLGIPAALKASFEFQPGQFLTLRATIEGADVRRSYSISSARHHLRTHNELEVGIRPVEGGVFSNWAASQLQAGDTLRVMAPEGRFVSQREGALHRVGFAAGSGITPILSILASTLQEQAESKFTLVYGNRSMNSVMFNEALQDLKDRYPDRLTLIHVLSRQSQEAPLFEGRIDEAKVHQLVRALLPAASMDEVFICGPEAMIEATEKGLLAEGVPANWIHSERFTSTTGNALAPVPRQKAVSDTPGQAQGTIALTVVLDGKSHSLRMNAHEHVLDVALASGLDLPYSCKVGVCCTCRAKIMQGSVVMDKNFTLEPWESAQGFVLSCQARPTTERLVVSYDER